MRIELPQDVKNIIGVLEAAGYEAYAVGGCVRDSLLGKKPEDWDITTSAAPAEVKALFSHTIDTGIEHGTVTVMQHNVGYEVTTYRIDGEYEDARHPKEVQFTVNLLEDLKRRDFTINAMAYNERHGIVDAFSGMNDLKKGVIRCVGEPRERFSEDALRMLRAVRFAAQLGFEIEEETKAGIKELAPTIAKVSVERIATELVKTLVSPNPAHIRLAYELHLTRVFLPEFDVMMETEQNTKHHAYSVGEHTLVALSNIRADRVLRIAMLFHDIAKPACKTTDEKGKDHFYGHQQEGVKMTKEILRRLKFDNDTIDKVSVLVRYHDERPSLSKPVKVRKLYSKLKLELCPLLFEVKRADVLAQSLYKREEKTEYIKSLEQMYSEIVENHICVEKKDMSVGGHDLIAMGMQPGKEIGRILDELFLAVLEEPELNNREKLLALANKLASPFI